MKAKANLNLCVCDLAWGVLPYINECSDVHLRGWDKFIQKLSVKERILPVGINCRLQFCLARKYSAFNGCCPPRRKKKHCSSRWNERKRAILSQIKIHNYYSNRKKKYDVDKEALSGIVIGWKKSGNYHKWV